MTGHVGQYAQRHTDNSRIARRHAVHAVVQVRPVGHGYHDQGRHDHKQEPPGSRLVFSAKAHHLGIIQIVVLHERNRGNSRFHFLAFVHNDFCIAQALCRNILPDHCVGTKPQCQADKKSQKGLSRQLVNGAQTILAYFHLDIVVRKPQNAQPHSRNQHQYHIDVTQTHEKQTGDNDGHNDNDTAHRGHTLLLHTIGIYGSIALRLTHVVAFHPFDEVFPEPDGNDQRQNQGQQSPERDVGPHVRTGNPVLS